MKKGRNVTIGIIVVSVLVPLLVAVLIFLPKSNQEAGSWITALPKLNAFINSLTSLLLLAGLYFVKKGKIEWHRRAMISAFSLGTLFLISYVTYHSQAESTTFGGEGPIRRIYYSLLISHIILAAIVVPFVLLALYYGLSDKVEKHRKVVKYAFPIWLYVSISGVLVYLLISPYY